MTVGTPIFVEDDAAEDEAENDSSPGWLLAR
jgi:hypothetical protein